MATCRVNWLPLKCRCEIGLEETRRTEEVDRTVQMSSHCRWPRQRGKQETDKLRSWFRHWLEIRTKSLFASRLLGMELLYYNKITAPEELESVSISNSFPSATNICFSRFQVYATTKPS